MKIIISPAKKMNIDTDSFCPKTTPQFLTETGQLQSAMSKLSSTELQNMWLCNDNIAKLNIQRLENMNLHKSLTPAIMAYEGIQYQYMAPDIFEEKHFDYIQENVRIISAFYGLLRPFDGVVPYRLEMQAKLKVNGHGSLYSFWGNKLATAVCKNTNYIINLTSKEYSKAIAPHLNSNVEFITCVFGHHKNGKILEKATMCKMARGQMVRWLAENNVHSPEQIKNFSELSFSYSEEHSTKNKYVFIKGEP